MQDQGPGPPPWPGVHPHPGWDNEPPPAGGWDNLQDLPPPPRPDINLLLNPHDDESGERDSDHVSAGQNYNPAGTAIGSFEAPTYCHTQDKFQPGAENVHFASVQQVGHRRALLHRFSCVMFEICRPEPDNAEGPQVDPPLYAPCRPSEVETRGLQLLPGVAERLEDCGIANLLRDCAKSLTHQDVVMEIPDRLDKVITVLRERFMEFRQDRVPALWRDGYANAQVMKAFWKLRTIPPGLPDEEAMVYMVHHLDKSLIVAGPSAGTFDEGWIEKTIDMMKSWEEDEALHATDQDDGVIATQQAMEAMDIDGTSSTRPGDGTFSRMEPFGRPQLSADHECPKHAGWSVSQFEDYMKQPSHPRPVIFTDQTRGWPALTTRAWNRRAYFLSLTFHGRRLVPVEIGRTYVDDGWGQELMPFGDFIRKYIDPPNRADQDPTTVGYVAQHDLFRQIPKLRNDILIPDLCWADVPGHPVNPHLFKPKLDMPQLNAWFGPARTITPLHTDGYHNLLCQVVGKKYVRLYPPWTDKEAIRPKGIEDGIDMSNTSELDLGVMEGWDEPPEDLDQIEIGAMRDDLKDVEYWECILEEGETLLIPMGWWHYVRSLSISFSISFWWN